MPHALSAEMQERGNGLPTVAVLYNQSRMAKAKKNAAAVALGWVPFGWEEDILLERHLSRYEG